MAAPGASWLPHGMGPATRLALPVSHGADDPRWVSNDGLYIRRARECVCVARSAGELATPARPGVQQRLPARRRAGLPRAGLRAGDGRAEGGDAPRSDLMRRRWGRAGRAPGRLGRRSARARSAGVSGDHLRSSAGRPAGSAPPPRPRSGARRVASGLRRPRGDLVAARAALRRALRYQPGALANRGVLSIFMRSLLAKRRS